MRYKYFRFNVIFRIVAILVLGYSGVYVLTQTHFWLVSFWLFLALVVFLISLIRYVEQSRRELAYFLLSIKQGDFTNTFPHQNKEDLNYAFHQINQVMKDLRNQKASNYLYLQTVVEHVRVAVICFDDHMKVELLNKAAKELFLRDQISSLGTMESISPNIAEKIMELESGERELVKVQIGGKSLNLSMLVTTFKLQEKQYKLVSFQDIRNELEEKEIESWQRLIRVLTHEIKNSVIPISTLSEVILQMFRHEAAWRSESGSESYQDIVGGLETIEARSKGLANFVKTYDKLTKLPKPQLQPIMLSELVERVHNLFKIDLERSGITWDAQLPQDHTIEADPDLIDQVVINIVKNAIEVLNEQSNKTIRLRSFKEQSKVRLTIQDSGPGIPDEVLENIFVPFYTTKQGGSGIGLSLSRQIMRLHRGNITVESDMAGTVFTLSF